MKLSLNWLKDFISSDIDPKELSESLTMGGLEVESVENLNGGVVFELGVPPNRSDTLSVFGLAREITALTGEKNTPITLGEIKGKGEVKDFISVAVKAKQACPRYTARVIRGVTISPSPKWIRDRLKVVGIRSINNVVDATNYVMMELGQPLHAFDYDLLNEKKILITLSDKDFDYKTLDEEIRKVKKGDLLISDGKGAVALAGIIGGGNSEVSDRTVKIVLESAYFEPKGIRRTAKRLGVTTESSKRFERGVDPQNTAFALNRLTSLILELAGGEPTSDFIDIKSKLPKAKTIVVKQSEIERILGTGISIKEAITILVNLGFEIKAERKQSVSVIVSSFRPDIERPADVIEELARVNGYSKIKETVPSRLSEPIVRPKFSNIHSLAHEALIGSGLSEAIVMEFDSEDNLALFSSLNLKGVAVTNPLSKEQAVMRTLLLPGLLTATKHNMYHQKHDVRLYSLQRVYYKAKNNKIEERLHIAGVVSGRRGVNVWDGISAEADFYEIKGIVERLFASLGLDYECSFIAKDDFSFLCPGKSAEVVVKGKNLGFMGGLHPNLVRTLDLSDEVFLFELDFETLAELSSERNRFFVELSKFPFVERDVAVLVNHEVSSLKVLYSIKNLGIPFLDDVKIFDMYKGKGIPSDKKSLAYSIKYLSHERTLTEDEINEAHEKIVKLLEKEFGAQLRT